MNALPMSILLISAAAAGSSALAKPSDQSRSSVHLRQALAVVAQAADPQGPKGPDHFNPKVDRGQGDDHANPGAILRVCSKDTPAAHRAAICPVGISPE